jgi:hypothetical protein
VDDGRHQPALGIARLNTLQNLADGNTIGLVAKGKKNNQSRGWVYLGGGSWRPDKQADADISQSALLALAGAGSEITFTGVLDGTEMRLGIDRDLDGFRDGDELDAGPIPAIRLLPRAMCPALSSRRDVHPRCCSWRDPTRRRPNRGSASRSTRPAPSRLRSTTCAAHWCDVS